MEELFKSENISDSSETANSIFFCALMLLPKDKKYLLLGPGVNCLSALNGCWSYSWQGDKEEAYYSQNQEDFYKDSNHYTKPNISRESKKINDVLKYESFIKLIDLFKKSPQDL